jgi:DNA-directed RNA polymerase subunit RPC12/RpoP
MPPGPFSPDGLEKPACIDCGSQGPTVAPRWPGYGHKSYVRCEPCGERRLARERVAIDKGYYSPAPPSDFHPLDAGENWDEDDY